MNKKLFIISLVLFLCGLELHGYYNPATTASAATSTSVTGVGVWLSINCQRGD